jgi:hypothetical protein
MMVKINEKIINLAISAPDLGALKTTPISMFRKNMNTEMAKARTM